MKKIFKLLTICLFMLWATSINVCAKELHNNMEVTKVGDTGTRSTSESVEKDSRELSSNVLVIDKNLIFDKELCDGEKRVLYEKDGEKVCVEVTDVTEMNEGVSVAAASDILTTSRVFTFYRENVLGVRTNLFSVTSVCTWIKGQEILDLTCTYTILKTGVSCSWDDTYKRATYFVHVLALDMTYLGDSYFFLFDATLNSETLSTLSLGCTHNG
ncbi:MAG: hypothetical protein IJZ82_06675 [Lachnospiraceae bacterium]|nr:hypothetical protein [Lachnospiraceae bacterium]